MKNKKLFAILTLVCFMFTLMPVAAFADADDLDNVKSVLFLADNQKNVLVETTDDEGNLTGNFETTQFEIALRTVAGNPGDVNATTKDDAALYIWATEGAAVSPAVTVEGPADSTNAQYPSNIANVYKFVKVDDKAKFTFSFARAGEYTIHAGFGSPTEDTLADVKEFTTAAGTITVVDTGTNPDGYSMTVTGPQGENAPEVGTHKDFYSYISSITPNNVSEKFTLSFDDNNNKDLIGKTVIVKSDSANLTVTPATAVTDALGRVKVDISASREGVYSVYVTVDGKTFVIGVSCGNTEAAYIETVEEPEHLVALYDSANALVSFKVTDINGNAVTDLDSNAGADGVTDDTALRAKYLQFIEKPATSNLVHSDLKLVPTATDGVYALQILKTLNAEGKYTVRAILDNGAVATASWEVKAFETPVKLLIEAPSTVELGKNFDAELSYLDANDVEKDAVDAKLAATGYAIYSFNGNTNTVTVKTDEKYAGQTITLTAASEMYDLVAVKEVKVAAEAVAIEFATNKLDVDVNNKVEWNVVDNEGNEVTLTDVADYNIKYVVLDKPEDAKVSVYDLTAGTFDGEGKMALTSNKVGNVTVQVIAQVQVAEDATSVEYKEVAKTDANGKAIYVVNGVEYTWNQYKDWNDFNGATIATELVAVSTPGYDNVQTKYYTGTEVFAVGTEGTGDVVVMSIGSTEIVINDEVSDMGVAPIIENGRTFVPYRAGLEALGATVAYDEATQSVSAEMNGVTVVMTIGSNVYTINGVEHTMDVAPFISESRTMVPARFAAQAFGITVIPTQNPDGTTADVLYIM